MKVRKRNLATVGAVVAALGLSACGSSNSSDSTSTPAASTAAGSTSTAAAAPSGPSFKIGTICSCSGAQASVLAGENDVYKAWASSVNAKGGIAGHPVEVVATDDAGDPAKALQNAKKLVTQDKVQALVDMSLADAAFAPYVAKSGVPVVGGLAVSLPFLTVPTFFPAGTSLPVATVGTAALAKAAGKTKMGLMYCAESPICKQLVPIAQGAAKLSGLGFSSTAVSATAASYAAPCLKLKNDKVDALFVADNSVIVQRIIAGCFQQGYKPGQFSQGNTYSPDWLKDPNLEGVQLANNNALYTDDSNPSTKELIDAVAKYAPKLPGTTAYGQDIMYAWSSGKLFEAAVAAGKLTPASTPADVTAAMYAIPKNETLGGIAPPLTFTKGKPAFPACYFTSEVKGGKNVALNGNKATCLTPAQAGALGKALAALVKG